MPHASPTACYDPAMRYAMIMAGGAGTRLWPMSRRAKPKQLLPFIHGRSLLQIAAERLEGLVPIERRLLCTGEAFRSAIREAMPAFTDEQILGEPMGRDTVNAVGLTAAVLHARDANAVFAVLTADHLIEPQDEFQRCVDIGFRLVEADPSRFVTFSITPTHPATGYGYVERGEPIAGFDGAYRAGRFAEKPDAETARGFLDSGRFNWNSGMFVFSAAKFMEAMKRWLPRNHAGLAAVGEAWGTPARVAVLQSTYPNLDKISVDYGMMEPASREPDFVTVCTVPMRVSWMDVGSWPSYGETLDADEHGNRTNANAVHLDSRNILTVADDPSHTFATIGCENLIIVRTKDATLVCRADQDQRVKDMAGAVQESLR